VRRAGAAAIITIVLLSAFAVSGPVQALPTQPQPIEPSASASPVPATPPQDTLAGLYSTTSMELVLLERRKGARTALKELERRIAADPRLAGVCHAIAHDLGHEALTEAHGVAATALAARNDVCGGGYTHGIIEMALGSSKHPARDLLTVCAPSQDGSCFHGVGHGLMFATGMNVARSIDLCDRAPSRMLAARCGEGVFMQLFGSDVSGGHAAPGSGHQTPDTARATCAKTRSPYSANCWFYAPTVWLAAHPDNFAGAMAWCASAGGPSGRPLCARGVGSRTIKYHPDDPSIGAAVCASAGSLRDPCLAGMGSYWSVHHKGKVPPSDVCRHLGGAALEARCLVVTQA